eukprot:scaffold318752_cov20-Prasinocladus_malaysianus.AAC.1
MPIRAEITKASILASTINMLYCDLIATRIVVAILGLMKPSSQKDTEANSKLSRVLLVWTP